MEDPTIGVELERSPPLEPPTPLLKFGRYDVLGRLAVGGMAEIFLTEEPVGDRVRRVIIKVLHRQLRADDAFEKLFLREGSIAMQLAHPNICAVYEFAKQSGHYYIAMEHVDGVSLWQLLGRLTNKRERMPPAMAAAICARVAAALDYAHAAKDARREPLGVIHRDVSPHNIMIRFDGVVKLLDFGVAKMKAREEAIERSTVKGKSAYLSPEQCRAQEIDGRTDVFSLGVCLAEALTGRRLFRRDSPFDTIKAIVEEDVPSVRERVPSLPADLDAVVAKARAKSRDERYATAGDFQVALERWLQKHDHVITDGAIRRFLEGHYPEESDRHPVLERGPEAIERLRSAVQAEAVAEKKRSPYLWAGAAALVVGVAIGAWAWSAGDRVAAAPIQTPMATPPQTDTEPEISDDTELIAATMEAAPLPEVEPDIEFEIESELESEVEPSDPPEVDSTPMMRRRTGMRRTGMRIRRDPGF